MIVWVMRDPEPLPLDPNNPRLMRNGMLCAKLAELGHRVRWFNSTFDHYQKRTRDLPPGSYSVSRNYTIELIEGAKYATNGSPRRLLHNALFARNMIRRGRQLARRTGERPDIIVTDVPVPDAALAAVRLAREWAVPSVVSIRDLWPDFFLEFLSPGKALFAQPAITLIDRQVKKALAEADHLIGISEGYLDWALRKAGRSKRPGDTIIPLGYSAPGAKAGEEIFAALEDKGVDFGKDLALFIGSWGRTYDLELLIKVIERHEEMDELQFVIAGDGERRNLLNSARQRLSNMILPGWLNQQEISALLSRSQVALAPYPPGAPQGLPNKVFEYMSGGLYQVASLGAEARQLLEVSGTGTVVPAGDPEAFANAVIAGLKSMREPGRREAVCRYFLDNFDADQVYRTYVTYLEDIASGAVVRSDA